MRITLDYASVLDKFTCTGLLGIGLEMSSINLYVKNIVFWVENIKGSVLGI